MIGIRSGIATPARQSECSTTTMNVFSGTKSHVNIHNQGRIAAFGLWIDSPPICDSNCGCVSQCNRTERARSQLPNNNCSIRVVTPTQKVTWAQCSQQHDKEESQLLCKICRQTSPLQPIERAITVYASTTLILQPSENEGVVERWDLSTGLAEWDLSTLRCTYSPLHVVHHNTSKQPNKSVIANKHHNENTECFAGQVNCKLHCTAVEGSTGTTVHQTLTTRLSHPTILLCPLKMSQVHKKRGIKPPSSKVRPEGMWRRKVQVRSGAVCRPKNARLKSLFVGFNVHK